MGLRLCIATILNLMLPGSGLILARREWLGFLLVIVVTVSGEAAIFGLLITPQALPTEVTAVAAGVAAATWLSAQLLLIRRFRALAGPNLATQLETCHNLAESAWHEGRLQDAYGALSVALTVDDEHLQTYVKMARLTTLLGRYDEALRTWRKVEQLDRHQEFRREMVQALNRLPHKGTQNEA